MSDGAAQVDTIVRMLGINKWYGEYHALRDVPGCADAAT